MIRLLSPIDLPQLTSLRSMLSCDEACTRDILNASEPTMTAMGVFFGQWVNLRLKQKQQSWICTGKQGLQGFVSVRGRNESFTWEIDHLLLSRSNDSGICHDLLQAVSHDSRNWAARRIFLRLAADSPLLDNVCQVGFTPYLRECLYQLNTRWMANKTEKPARLTVRPLHKVDEYQLFELYNAVFPAAVRCIEGVTFGEWREVRGSLACQQWKRQLICENKGDIVAQLKTTHRGKVGQFEVMISPGEDMEEILQHVMVCLSRCSIIRCLVPAHDSALIETLQRHGFVPMVEYDVFANLSAIRVHKPALAPVHI